MTTLNKGTKKYQYYLNAYKSTKGRKTLNDVYNYYSNDKHKAYLECLKIVREYNGHNIHITTYNKNVFTLGFRGWCPIKEEFCLYIITPTNIYRLYL